MELPKTLAQRFGRPPASLDWSKVALVLIDHQREYDDGGLPLAGIKPAVAECAALLELARRKGALVIHVQHLAPAGAPLFDSAGPFVEFIPGIGPMPGEAVVSKALPNSFAGTTLQAALAEAGCKQLVIAGFMTHMCVSTTTRAAAELGYVSWVVADACATRDLPLPWGEAIRAADVHRAALAELNDSFAQVVRCAAALS
jgi:nicotinamidase-related amidase